MLINRSYDHKTHGHIGSVRLSAPAEGWTLDGKPLPESSVEYLLTFSLQALQDAYAGAKTQGEARGMFAAKRDRLAEGTIGVRSAGAGFTTVEKKALQLFRNEKIAALAAYKAIDSTDQPARLAFVVKVWEAVSNDVRAAYTAKAEIVLEAEKEAVAVDIDLAALGIA